MLGELSERQEDARGLVRDVLREHPAASDLEEDSIVAVMVSFKDMAIQMGGDDPESPFTEDDVTHAIHFLDNLDTLGKMVTGKP